MVRASRPATRSLDESSNVLVRDYRGGEKWQEGEVMETLGNRHYKVLVDGNVWKRHIDQLVPLPPTPEILPGADGSPPIQIEPITKSLVNIDQSQELTKDLQVEPEPNSSSNTKRVECPPLMKDAAQVRKSSRLRKPVEKLNL